jgi:hypothetical protein
VAPAGRSRQCTEFAGHDLKRDLAPPPHPIPRVVERRAPGVRSVPPGPRADVADPATLLGMQSCIDAIAEHRGDAPTAGGRPLAYSVAACRGSSHHRRLALLAQLLSGALRTLVLFQLVSCPLVWRLADRRQALSWNGGRFGGVSQTTMLAVRSTFRRAPTDQRSLAPSRRNECCPARPGRPARRGNGLRGPARRYPPD